MFIGTIKSANQNAECNLQCKELTKDNAAIKSGNDQAIQHGKHLSVNASAAKNVHKKNKWSVQRQIRDGLRPLPNETTGGRDLMCENLKEWKRHG